MALPAPPAPPPSTPPPSWFTLHTREHAAHNLWCWRLTARRLSTPSLLQNSLCLPPLSSLQDAAGTGTHGGGTSSAAASSLLVHTAYHQSPSGMLLSAVIRSA